MPTLEDARKVLQETWGYPDFRGVQADAVKWLVEDELDVLCTAPTGLGKSAMYQVPALVMSGTCIVISPLIALMKDQVDQAREKGIRAAYINSHLDQDEIDKILVGLPRGTYDLLYIAPERLSSPRFLDAAARTQVCLIACDESHMISSAGNSYRPDYLRVHRLVQATTDFEGYRPPIAAVTATATLEVLDDIKRALKIPDAKLILGDPIRENLTYQTHWTYGSSWSLLSKLSHKLSPSKGRHVIYVTTRKGAETTSEVLEERFPGAVAVYHAGFSKTLREAAQDDFASGRKPIVVATTAFGMGIDVPDIRTVVNFGFPSSIEDLVQQSGRAGRDGEKSDTILICDQFSRSLQTWFVEAAHPEWCWFEVVWRYLKSLPSQGVLMTVSEMAEDINATQQRATRGIEIDNRVLSGVLSKMSGRGLIDRPRDMRGIPVTIDTQALTDLSETGTGDRKADTFVEYLTVAMKEELGGLTPPEALIVHISKAEAAGRCGTTDYGIGKFLSQLQQDPKVVLKVGKVFRGKPTKVLRPEITNLEEVLPRAEMEEKRAKAMYRLNSIFKYGKLETEDERKALIRKYFTEEIPVPKPIERPEEDGRIIQLRQRGTESGG